MAKRLSSTRTSTASPRSVSNAASNPLASTKKAFSDPIAVAVMIGTIVAATAAVGGLAYSIGKDVGQAELKTRQDLASINLPQIAEDTRTSTADLKTASAAFKDLLVNNATYQEMLAKHEAQLKQIAELNSTVQGFTERNQSQQETIANLEARLAVHENPEAIYKLEKGTSQQAAGGEIIVGLHYYMSGFAELTINNQRESAQAGTIFDVKGMKGGQCRVKIISVSATDTASFSAECLKNGEKASP
ncbi:MULTISPECIES: hypothetical protein [Rhizobium/Agrobacterium group]|uniref:hypothetical protein n=1 Tax=Rhizobium/Agrobacterium group TaxID=227290 RepID=UPI0011784887|nr:MULTISPECIES: hypothetical protein [Rhizobium/Agrobacterium group]MCF1482467.1 hypothetical protein [Allorhizobium ampelinum]NSZ43892.1 hypothetical protein [Agrobacterium vitis]NTA27640.1 hypothetical protein [Allorhizobium ampelinum]